MADVPVDVRPLVADLAGHVFQGFPHGAVVVLPGSWERCEPLYGRRRGEEPFDVTVCSPEWLAKTCREVGGICNARHHLVVSLDDFDMRVLRAWLAARVQEVEADTWPASVWAGWALGSSRTTALDICTSADHGHPQKPEEGHAM
ncbi:Imm8 family immunity protein [Actinoplanes sp. KI2]|uniref:Imm8 family immunity protein n=1 Tax=Actinoplanes sp. KI2 TaxID=2983315 RepID=UPI0039831DA5